MTLHLTLAIPVAAVILRLATLRPGHFEEPR